MARIRVTKEFTFEMAHALEGYDGACRQIHGHSYRLFVTVIGTPAESLADPKCGMVLDFGELKRMVNRTVVDRFDHAFVVRRSEALGTLGEALKIHFGKVEVVDYQPTCENMIAAFAEYIGSALPARIRLFSLRLHETATAYAEWYASDNC